MTNVLYFFRDIYLSFFVGVLCWFWCRFHLLGKGNRLTDETVAQAGLNFYKVARTLDAGEHLML